MSAPALEFWTIYDSATGRIRASGYGPAGSASAQTLRAGEVVLPQRSQPNVQMVDTTGAKPFIKLKPNQAAPGATLAVPNLIQSANGTNWQLGATDGGAPTLTKL